MSKTLSKNRCKNCTREEIQGQELSKEGLCDYCVCCVCGDEQDDYVQDVAIGRGTSLPCYDCALESLEKMRIFIG